MNEPTDPLEPGLPKGQTGSPIGDESGTGFPSSNAAASLGESVPCLYIASPLTGLDPSRREQMSQRIATVKQAVLDATHGDRPDDDTWPVTMHVPWDHSAPWKTESLSPGTIYENNLERMINSDGLIVVADNTCSAGIGQEIEWAVRCGIPVLYLGLTDASRQIRGIPHAIDVRTYADAETLSTHVRHWLSSQRSRLLNGPRRRTDRFLSYVKLTAHLEVAWKAAANPTTTALQLGLHPSAIDSLVRSPERVALTPWWTICELAAGLGVALEVRRALSFTESRGWVLAADEGSWDQKIAERVRSYAMSIGADNLALPTSWSALYIQLFGPAEARGGDS